MGAEGFHGRVRDGIGCGTLAIAARSSQNRGRMTERSARACGTSLICLLSSVICHLTRVFADGDRGLIKLYRAIRTGQLHALLRVHIRPIDVLVLHGSYGEAWF